MEGRVENVLSHSFYNLKCHDDKIKLIPYIRGRLWGFHSCTFILEHHWGELMTRRVVWASSRKRIVVPI